MGKYEAKIIIKTYKKTLTRGFLQLIINKKGARLYNIILATFRIL